jgi:uncharacterized protein with GYD domain
MVSRTPLYEGPSANRARMFKLVVANGRASVRAMVSDPQDRAPAVAATIEQVGGRLHHAWVTLSAHDTLAIVELPDEIAANALWSTFKAGGAVDRISLAPMISLQDHVEALKLAAQLDHTPPQGRTWERSQFERPERAREGRVLYRPAAGVQSRLFKVEMLDCNPDSVRAMITEPHDRTPAVESALKQVGGRLHHAWMTLSDYDTLMIAELPDEIAANALWSVFKAGAGVVEISMEPIITLEQHVEALKLASQIEYLPPQGRTWDPGEFKQGAPAEQAT